VELRLHEGLVRGPVSVYGSRMTPFGAGRSGPTDRRNPAYALVLSGIVRL
jgi:hypothetical protein